MSPVVAEVKTKEPVGSMQVGSVTVYAGVGGATGVTLMVISTEVVQPSLFLAVRVCFPEESPEYPPAG